MRPIKSSNIVIAFDLDDTLYDESAFVRSGFSAVADYLQGCFSIPSKDSLAFMLEKLPDGRGRIFDDLLMINGILSEKNVKRCLSVYRSHAPQINLYEEAADCLDRFRKHPIYIVSDGNKIVQHNKLKALGLYDRVKFCYLTHRYGKDKAKPSPYCFFKICEREGVEPCSVIYVGDDPNKDFVGIKPFGFRTVRVLKGRFGEVERSREFEAEHKINSLVDLTISLIE